MKQGTQWPWAGGGPCGTESQRGGQDSLQHSKLAFQKRLALLDFSDPRASKRHRSLLRTLSRQHPGTLAPSSRAGELESPRSKEETGHGWEESAPCPEQHPSVPRGGGLLGEGDRDPAGGAWPCWFLQQKLDQSPGCPGRRQVAQNRTPSKQRGVGPKAKANVGKVQPHGQGPSLLQLHGRVGQPPHPTVPRAPWPPGPCEPGLGKGLPASRGWDRSWRRQGRSAPGEL